MGADSWRGHVMYLVVSVCVWGCDLSPEHVELGHLWVSAHTSAGCVLGLCWAVDQLDES